MIIYILCTNSLYEWFDLCISGLKEFTKNKTSYLQFCIEGKYVYVLFSIVLFILWIISIIKILKKKDKTGICLIIYSIAILSIMYPIATLYHVIFAMFLLPINIMYAFSSSNSVNEKIINKINYSICIFKIILAITLSILGIYVIINSTNIKHYKYIIINEEIKQKIENISYFINSKESVYFLDSLGITYLIPNDKYIGYFELPLVGNTGIQGEKLLINKIRELQNTYILVRNLNYKSRAQNPIEAIQYVKDNYKYIDKIEDYYIYYVE